jgi:hypothetical protein
MPRLEMNNESLAADAQGRHFWNRHWGTNGARRRVALAVSLAAVVLLLAVGLMSIHLGSRPA